MKVKMERLMADVLEAYCGIDKSQNLIEPQTHPTTQEDAVLLFIRKRKFNQEQLTHFLETINTYCGIDTKKYK